MKVIFLDFDGVLNSLSALREKRYVLVDPCPSSFIDPEAARRVASLVQRADAQVVISSTWRLLYELDTLRGHLAQFGIPPERVIDITPKLIRRLDAEHSDGCPGHPDCTCRPRMSEPDAPRGHEIKLWLLAHPDVSSFVILDDDSDMDMVDAHLVKTTWDYGMQDGHVERALEVLEVPK